MSKTTLDPFCLDVKRIKKCVFSSPKRMNFRKSSKRPLTSPPLIFGKLCCNFFKLAKGGVPGTDAPKIQAL